MDSTFHLTSTQLDAVPLSINLTSSLTLILR